MTRNLSKNCSLMSYVVDLLQFNDLCFPQYFQCINFSILCLGQGRICRSWLNEADTGKRPCSMLLGHIAGPFIK